MSDYKFTFGYLALKMLGKTLYSNPIAALSELIANGFDAKANKVWLYVDIRNKQNSIITIMDDGKGMTDEEVISKYLQVGKQNRPDNDSEMMGRKGIGKLAAFYLSDTYYIATKTTSEENYYSIDFSLHERGERGNNDDVYMDKTDACQFPSHELRQKFLENETGTAIILTKVNLMGYGYKTFEVMEAELAELFCRPDKEIYLKLIEDDTDENRDFNKIKRKIAFLNMAKICYTDNCRYDIKEFDKKEISNVDDDSNELDNVISVERIETKHLEAELNGRIISFSPTGWIGIHSTIDKEKAHKNDPKNFINSKLYHFNKVRIYVRGKLALENILPYVHNTQYYVNYIEGDIECDVLDQNDLPDIASSSRQDIDKNDPRFIKLIDYITELVNKLVNYKTELKRKNKESTAKRQQNAVEALTFSIRNDLLEKVGKKIKERDVDEFSNTIANSFKQVSDIAKTRYVLFISHKKNENRFADLLYNYLRNECLFEDDYIFYTSKPGGVDQSIEILEKQINKTLTSENSYVVFCIEGKEFKKSEYCMFEGGAAWAVKQNSFIGLAYNNYDKDVPNYLKSLRNRSICLRNVELNRDNYISLVNLVNSIIVYLNNNYIDESQKKKTISNSLPSDVELSSSGKKLEEFFNSGLMKYWNIYISNIIK